MKKGFIMVKVISVVLVVAGLSWYWLKNGLETTDIVPTVGEVQKETGDDKAIYLQIQESLKQLITENVQKKLPDAKNIVFQSFRITSLRPDQLKADFIYAFDDKVEGKDSVEIDGFAILNKEPEEKIGHELWKVERVQVLRNHITFEDGIVTKVTRAE